MVIKSKLESDMAQTRELYANYLKGKRVAIVGPAPSILNSKQKEKLENFDVIVRLNKAVPVPADLFEDIGTRTDVLYNCMNPSQECGGFIDIDLLHKHKVKFLVAPYCEYKEYRFGNDVLDFAERNLKSNAPISFCHIDKTLFARLMEIMKLPNTGINAIIDVLQHDIKELYITGLTFFRGGYIKQYRGYSEKQVLDRMAKYKLHDQDKQLAYMKKLLRNNPRVNMDQALTDIIYEDDKLLSGADKMTFGKIIPIKIESNLIQKKETNLIITINENESNENQKEIKNQIEEIKNQIEIPENATILAISKPQVISKVIFEEPPTKVNNSSVSCFKNGLKETSKVAIPSKQTSKDISTFKTATSKDILTFKTTSKDVPPFKDVSKEKLTSKEKPTSFFSKEKTTSKVTSKDVPVNVKERPKTAISKDVPKVATSKAAPKPIPKVDKKETKTITKTISKTIPKTAKTIATPVAKTAAKKVTKTK